MAEYSKQVEGNAVETCNYMKQLLRQYTMVKLLFWARNTIVQHHVQPDILSCVRCSGSLLSLRLRAQWREGLTARVPIHAGGCMLMPR